MRVEAALTQPMFVDALDGRADAAPGVANRSASEQAKAVHAKLTPRPVRRL